MSHLPGPAPARPTAPMQTNWGAPMPDPAHSLTVGPRGPIVLDQQFFDMHQVREAPAWITYRWLTPLDSWR
jgi:hypothetical protein